MHWGVSARDKGSIVIYLTVITNSKSKLPIYTAFSSFHQAALSSCNITKTISPPFGTGDMDYGTLDAPCKV